VLLQYDFRIQHRSGRKHVNVDSLSRIPSEPEVCACYEGHLTLEEPSCKGCDTCSRKHKQWSDFSQFDDAVPLFAKRIVQISGSSKARVSRVKLQESGFWGWIFLLLQLQVVKLLNCVRFMYFGLLRIRKYRRYRIFRLRFREHSENSDADYSSKADDRNYEMPNKDGKTALGEMSSSVKSLVKFSKVFCSSERMARLQQQDPDIGVVLKWLKSDSRRPPRDTVSGYSPSVRN